MLKATLCVSTIVPNPRTNAIPASRATHIARIERIKILQMEALEGGVDKLQRTQRARLVTAVGLNSASGVPLDWKESMQRYTWRQYHAYTNPPKQHMDLFPADEELRHGQL
eukprot:3789219-Amphidinium_carterae.1